MSSRAAILRSVRRHNAPAVSRPNIPDFAGSDAAESVSRFIRAVEEVAGQVIAVGGSKGMAPVNEPSTTVQEALDACYPGPQAVGCSREGLRRGAVVVDEETDARALASLDVYICEAGMGVAENGAVWLSKIGHPVEPFGAAELAVILDRRDVVWDMHEAYRKIDTSGPDYAVFVSGPSKTADIEQSLVIGAHGPRKLRIFLL